MGLYYSGLSVALQIGNYFHLASASYFVLMNEYAGGVQINKIAVIVSDTGTPILGSRTNLRKMTQIAEYT